MKVSITDVSVTVGQDLGLLLVRELRAGADKFTGRLNDLVIVLRWKADIVFEGLRANRSK